MKQRNPKAAFGLFDHTMLPKLNRLLKSHGLKLKTRSDRLWWGDQVEVTVEHIPMDIGKSIGIIQLEELEGRRPKNAQTR